MKYIKTLSLPFALIVAFIGYIFYGKGNANQLVQSEPVPTSDTASVTPSSAVPPVISGKPISKYKDGTYTGDSVDAYFGNVQVAAVISGGKIADVTFLKFPNDRSTSVNISNTALPQLKAEVIKAQKAEVNVISGATQTSEGFVKSLETALVKAQA
jgi:uncharacterized protein with FMN-binding domain